MKKSVLFTLLFSLPVTAFETISQEAALFKYFGIKHAMGNDWITHLNNQLAEFQYPSLYQAGATNYLFEHYPALKMNIPYISLAALPTPIEKLKSLSREYGVEMYIKRDDLTGGFDVEGCPIYGGNKVRKLEFLLAMAQKLGATKIMTFGCVGSNHAVATAVHARRLHMEPICMLKHQEPSTIVQQNLLMHRMCDTELHYSASHDIRKLESLIVWLSLYKKDGQVPYIIPTGGSNYIGALGCVNAAFELKEQIDKGLMPMPTHIYLPCGSCGTTAGLLLGCKAAGLNIQIVAVAVEPNAHFERGIAKLFHETNGFLRSMDASFPECSYTEQDLRIVDDCAGTNYGIFTAEGNEATRKMLDVEGVQLEGTYTAKACAGMLDDLPSKTGSVVLFWNTYCGLDFAPALKNHSYEKHPKFLHDYFTKPLAQ